VARVEVAAPEPAGRRRRRRSRRCRRRSTKRVRVEHVLVRREAAAVEGR
jgi:hypothetical protein